MGSALQIHAADPTVANGGLLRWQQAQQLIKSRRSAEALPAYVALIKQFPSNHQLQFECGLAAVASLDFGLANRCFAKVHELAPDDAETLLALGQQYHRLRQPAQARACFEAAIAVAPDSAPARLGWAAWLEREHKLAEAWECNEETVAKNPHEPGPLYYRAFLMHRQGRASEAEAVLRPLVKRDLPDPNLQISCRHLLAVVLDELGQYDEALGWLREAKSGVRALANVPALEQAYDKTDRARRQLLTGLTPQMIRRWRTQTPPSVMPCPLALLGGHPRSGTTLLEQILGAHPDVLAFDESEAFASEIWEALEPMHAPPTSAAALDGLSPSRCSAVRARYFKSLFRELAAPPAGKVLLDKNPGPTAALHLWLRLFPASKVIIALRDPRDVILSCYFQQLTLTPMNANFLSLERAAKYYGDLMDVWLRVRELGGFDAIETRYEDFAGDPEKEGRRVTEFLGLTWRPDQARSHEAARRTLVFSPTYNDVTKPAHNRAIGRWKHYADALAPLQPALSKYCQTFGY
ncbi:MAG TPA: sulfotransferase [Verrucomicrobiae bacterium]|nr:sulfotransferase [Verrucomicrobiae bacterium]